ncbi:hypothetical protein H7849_15455 [Alloacidobacterium dinghuense]|uniref:Uncharacterized protein n=1 Tax=Alloacidobacterium dinghuense TaxID=2763107 RepID=A0A7G8BDB6_9BACT|nr:hypothetical protein [Alloacidobacterium dinghuense]QNI30536.1 hypothetical protein H7849_15455 [Alloacidobacterium dinghuense]
MYNECRHIFTSGKKCQSPALKAEDFCYFHHKSRRRPSPQNQPYEPYTEPKETALNLSPLEDADAIQLAISDVVLALAANRIDSRRARILIYGLQVASQNNRHRAAMAVKEATIEQTVREAHEHADGTLIGPEKQSPEPEEAAARKRPPSLGEILLRQAEELSARKAEEARLKAERERAGQQEAGAESANNNLPQAGNSDALSSQRGITIHAVAEMPSARPTSRCRRDCHAFSHLTVKAERFSLNKNRCHAMTRLTDAGPWLPSPQL